MQTTGSLEGTGADELRAYTEGNEQAFRQCVARQPGVPAAGTAVGTEHPVTLGG